RGWKDRPIPSVPGPPRHRIHSPTRERPHSPSRAVRSGGVHLTAGGPGPHGIRSRSMLVRSHPHGREHRRHGVFLIVVLSLLTLFAIIGLSFVLFADAAATAANIQKQSETQTRADIDPQLALSWFLGQFLYDMPDDDTGVYSAMRGHSL